MPQRHSLASLACAALALLLALAWQFLVVRFNYGGNWTGLFCIGDRFPAPPSRAPQGLYRFSRSLGYDGQFYLLVAHDPLLRADLQQYVDNPPLRWRRILVPGLAYVAAGARPQFIPAAYVGVVLAAVFGGAWWLSRFLGRAGCNAFWGLGFLLVPSVAVSLDRMTVDGALAALSVAFALYACEGEDRRGPLSTAGAGDSACRYPWKIYPVLLLAPLARETGLSLVLAFCLLSLACGKRKQAALGAAMGLPWLAWALFVRVRLWPDGTPWIGTLPLAGLLRRTFHPVQFQITGAWTAVAAALDYAALLGVWFALFIAGRFAWQLGRGAAGQRSPLVRAGRSGEGAGPALLRVATVVFAAGVAFVGKPDVWADAYAFARTMSPLLVWPALLGLATRSCWRLGPLALTIPRIAFQVATVSLPVLRGLLGLR